MADMLVKLYNLADDWSFLDAQQRMGVTVRKPIGPERHILVSWVAQHFSAAWSSETDQAMSNHPISCFIATQNQQIIGFACYDATALSFFGPTGVLEASRGKGTGKALLLACMLDMKLKARSVATPSSAGSGRRIFIRRQSERW